MKTSSKSLFPHSRAMNSMTPKKEEVIRSHSISRLFSKNKTIMNYMDLRLNSNLLQENSNSSLYSSQELNQSRYKKRFFPKQFNDTPIKNRQFFRLPHTQPKKKTFGIFSHEINSSCSSREVEQLKLENLHLKKEITKYKVLFKQVFENKTSKETFNNSINTLSSNDNNND